MKGLYKGFSFHEYIRNRSFSVTDQELVKLDILSYIYTPKGSRYNMPRYGTNLHMMTFESLDEITLDAVEQEIVGAIEYDPRVQLLSIRVEPDHDNNAILAEVMVLYLELNMTDIMYLNIDTGQLTA